MSGLSFSCEERSLDRFLQFLGGAERDLLGSLDLDGFAGGGIAAHARTALAHDENAQAIEANTRALLQVLGDQGDGFFNDLVGALLREFFFLGELGGELAGGNGFNFCFGDGGHGILPLNESTMSPILRHFSQDKAARPQKSARNWGFFHIYAKKAPKTGLLRASKSTRAAQQTPRGPICVDSKRLQAASGPAFSVRSVIRADLPVRPRR